MQTDEIRTLVLNAVEELKAVNVRVLDVREQTSMTDVFVIAGGTSARHVKAIAHNVTMKAKAAGMEILGVEGEGQGEWVLVDLGDVVAHVMLPQVREFYQLERLWESGPAPQRASA